MPKNYPILTFIDCETTGLNPVKDRIIEIAAIRVENGVVTKKLNTLLNPEYTLPRFINNITGISQEMLQNKPTFYEIKNDLQNILKDSLFVSHNSHFDYGFIKEEFRRQDINYRSKHLCTVRLFKKLYPQVCKHNLDSLIKHFGFKCKKRHRAMSDCRILVNFYSKIINDFGDLKVNESIKSIVVNQSLPPKIILSDVARLPNLPGVYIFYSKDNIPLYVGKSINIKERVASHFSNITSVTDLKLVKEVYRIKYIECAGEFGALITENKKIKELMPIYNKKLKRNKKLIAVLTSEAANNYNTLKFVEFSSIENLELKNIVAIFKSLKAAKEFIIKKSSEFKLCLKILNIDKSKNACFNYNIGKCNGACKGIESYLSHNIKFIMAFTSSNFINWPYKGPKIITEQNENGLIENHLIDNWKYLGKIDPEDLGVKTTETGVFDLDEYKILSKFLFKK